MSNYKVKFTLKQHTPIIHFQSEQSGATLRATELKPKFDKFLLQQVKDLPYKTNANGDKSLEYKVKIQALGKERSLPNKFLYFANNAIKNPKKKVYMVATPVIKVEFFSFNIQVLKAIKIYFEEFMLITNFGARSSKGYGSFYKIRTDSEKILKKYYPYVFKISNVNIKKWEDKVDTIHKRLKSGINFGEYHRSLLFQYMCTKNIRWEKRKIKQTFPNLIGANDKSPIDCHIIDNDKFRYVRAMLGVASINEYAKGSKTVTISSLEIERFHSPIIYKVIENNIYLLCDTSYEKVMDRDFTFAYGDENFSIKTPAFDEFNLYEFLQFVQKETNLIAEVAL